MDESGSNIWTKNDYNNCQNKCKFCAKYPRDEVLLYSLS